MFSSNKFLTFVFVLLFFVFGFELVYLFYYQPLQSQKNPIPTVPTVSTKPKNAPTKPTFVYDENSASLDGSQINKIVLDAEKNKYDFISKVSLLNSLAKINNSAVDSSFQLDNLGEKWKAYSDENFPVAFQELVLMRLKFDSKTGPSGISLGGYTFQENKAINIFFGTGDDGKKLYIDAKNNNDDPSILFNSVFEKKLDGIYVLFNKKGSSFLVTDLLFNRIVNINLNEETNNKFPNGVFPNNQFFIAYALSPQSNLIVTDLSILIIK